MDLCTSGSQSFDDFYKILGCSDHTSMEQINVEYKARVLECHPDKNQHDKNAEFKFKKLQEAKQTLTDPRKRKEYDRWKGSGLGISYQEWCSMRERLHMSLHWCNIKQDSSAMIEHPESESNNNEAWSTSFWERDLNSNDLLKKFRNYDI